MEVVTEFVTFCNICFIKESLRKIEETEHLLNILITLIENKTVVKDHDVYLCLNCCAKLESYGQLKEMCLRNLNDFRVEYFELKQKLERICDPNVEKKLKNFIETKVYGAIEIDDSGDTIEAECNVLSKQESEKKITEKENQGNDYNDNLRTASYKTEVDYEDIENYKLHTEVDLENSENDFELSARVEYVQEESYVEDTVASESSNKNEVNGSSEPALTCSREDEQNTLTDLSLCKNLARNDVLNINTQPTSQNVKENECEICKETFAEVGVLQLHECVHTGKKTYLCKVCNKTYAHQRSLKAHEFQHTGKTPYKCSICNKAFSLRKRLKEHIYIHSDEKPHTCFICNKTFKRLLHLKDHERVHTGEKPFACSMCDKTFSNSGYLKLHVLVHTGEKPYNCKVCDKSFRHVSHLKVHERVHIGEKPYECTVCNKRFTHLNSYKCHKSTHSAEKLHSCSVCKNTFRHSSSLRKHERIHTGIKSYSCDICKKVYVERRDLISHKKKSCVPNAAEKKVTEESEKT